MRLNSILIIFFAAFLSLNTIQAKHITGGYVSYEVLSATESRFIVNIYLTMFRDPFGEGANFDNALNLGIYRILEDETLLPYERYQERPLEILDITSDFLNCRGALPEYELGRYEIKVEIPNDGYDYQIGYQRCCRSNSILGVQEIESSGMLFTTRINYESLVTRNTSPTLTDVDNRFFEVNKTHPIEMSFTDVDGDQIVITPLTPYEVGGVAGVNFGDPEACDGILPNPMNCPPAFNTITYKEGFSLEKPFGDQGDFIDEGNGNFSFTCQNVGMYLLGFKVEEFRNGELLTVSNYETTILTGLKEANQAAGQFYFDENGNGLYDEGELPFPITPKLLNDDYCNYGVSNEHYYELLLSDPVAEFKNVAEHFTFTNDTDLIASPDLSLQPSTEFDIGFIEATSIEEVTLSAFNGVALCHRQGNLTLELSNTGTLPTEGQIVLSNIKNVSILDCDCDISIEAGNIVIKVDELKPLRSVTFDLLVQYADETHIDEAVTVDFQYTSIINPNVGSLAKIEDVIVCAFDPNDIAVTPYRLPDGLVENGERLLVKIRFENKGNWPASKVSIDQLLDEHLDPSTIKVIEASHDYIMMTSKNDNIQTQTGLKFLFKDINLSGKNDPEQSNREGHVVYSIDMKPELPLGTLINHEASIVFDINKPIETNLVRNIVGILGEEELDEEADFEQIKKNLKVYPNPAEDLLLIDRGEAFKSFYISNATRKLIREGEIKHLISLEDLHPGIYIITFVHENGHRVSRKFVKI
ncbi:MAG: T9SS type A sorting domain-containing protein [Bacteroidota bacterium]